MKTIERQDLKKKIDDGEELLLVDVLGEDSFRDYHLPGALNFPVDSDAFETSVEAVADKDSQIVVYCKNKDCNASPRAAERLEKIGFSNVLDYAAGKEDWRAAGLPMR